MIVHNNMLKILGWVIVIITQVENNAATTNPTNVRVPTRGISEDEESNPETPPSCSPLIMTSFKECILGNQYGELEEATRLETLRNALHEARHVVRTLEDLLRREEVSASENCNAPLDLPPLSTTDHLNFTDMSLVDAVKVDNVDAVKYRLQQGDDPNASDELYLAPIHYAAAWNSTKALKYLAEEGTTANINLQRGRCENTPLHIAVERNFSNIVKILVENGADLNIKNWRGFTPLHIAVGAEPVQEVVKTRIARAAGPDKFPLLHRVVSRCDKFDIAQFLIDSGADVNAKANNGDTPLHAAARANCDLQVVEELVRAGANVSAVNNDGETPASLSNNAKDSSIHNYLQMLPTTPTTTTTVNPLTTPSTTPLTSHPPNTIEPRFINVTLFEAVHTENLEALHYHLVSPPGNGISSSGSVVVDAIYWATWLKNLRVLQFVMEQVGADYVNVKSARGNGPLHFAASHSDLEGLEYLVEKGADVNATDSAGNTPLHNAASQKHFPPVKYLVEIGGADVNSTNARGYSPLHNAVVICALESIKLFKQNNVDVNSVTNNGDNPLHLAARADCDLQLVQYLVESGGNTLAENKDGNTALELCHQNGSSAVFNYLEAAQITQANLISNSRKYGNMTLFDAVTAKNLEAVRYRVEAAGDNATGSFVAGRTALHIAVLNGDLPMLKYFVEEVRGVDVNPKDFYGYTPLHLAAEYNANDAIRYLIGKGGNVSATDNDGYTPLHRAVSTYLSRPGLVVVQSLVESGADLNPREKLGYTPLHLTLRFSRATTDKVDNLVRYLIGKGADLNTRLISSGRSPLHTAAEKCLVETFMFLMQNGADMNARNFFGELPTQVAGSGCKDRLTEQVRRFRGTQGMNEDKWF